MRETLRQLQRPLFKEMNISLRAYLDMLSVNADRVSLLYTRSWGTVSERGQSIRRHRHNQSHISIVYYPVKAENTGNLIFHMPDPMNELSPGLFEPHALKQGLLKASTPLNSEMVDLPVAEDDIVIFPSKTFHGTDPNNTNGSRRDDDAEGHHGCGVSAANGWAVAGRRDILDYAA